MSNFLAPLTTECKVFGRMVLSFLEKRLVAAANVTRSYQDVTAGPGDKFDVPEINVEGTAAIRAIGGAATASDIATGRKTFTFQHIYKGVSLDNLEVLFSSIAMMDNLAQQLGYGVAEKFDGLVCDLWNQMPWEVGEVDGTAAFNSTDKLDHVNSARKRLSNNKAPLDDLVAIVNPSEAYRLRALDTLVLNSNAGDSAMLRRGDPGSIYNVRFLESQQISNAEATGTSDGAWAVDGAHARGVSTLAVKSMGTGSVKKGTTFSIDSGSAAGRYVVTADATITANAASLSIFPALRGAAAGDEVCTATLHSATGSQNLVFAPSGILAISRAPAALQGGVVSEVVVDEQSGLAIRLSIKSNLLGGAGTAFSSEIVADAVVAVGVVNPEACVRITGEV